MSLRLPLIILVSVLFMGLTMVSVNADDKSLKPTIPKGKGEQCVAETDFMRRNHMDLLKHDRDLTVYHGLREIDFSLKGCIDCHTVKDDKSQALTVKDERHFCRACHDFAAVTVDCFQCHASRPGDSEVSIDDKAKMPLDKSHAKIVSKTSKQERKP